MGRTEQTAARLEAELKKAHKRIIELESKISGKAEGEDKRATALANDVLYAAPDLIWLKDPDGVYQICNAAFEQLLGRPQSEIVGKTDALIAPEKWAKIEKEYDLEALKSGEPGVFEEEMVFAADGKKILFETIKTPLKDSNGNVTGVLSVARDISARKQREIALSEEVQRSKMLMEISHDGIAIFDQNHRIIEASKSFIERLGYSPEEILTLHSWDFDVKFSKEEILSSFGELSKLKEHFRNSIETQHRRKDGSVYDAEVTANGAVFGNDFLTVTITRDITERKEKEKLARQINQINKREAVGQLAAGIAHDFNNVLTGIIGAANTLTEYLPDQPKAKKMHQIILDAAGRASSMISSLLVFSRESPHSETPVDVHSVIQDALALLDVSIDKRIIVKTKLEASTSSVIGDPSLLQNMFLNLCINSCHAMPEGGMLSISTTLQELDEKYCKTAIFDISPGLFLEIEVRDTGCGIPKDALDKVFDPFFTTKEQGKGTGLGLSSAYGTVQQHKGAIFVYSEPDIGAVFQILLPLNQDEPVLEIQRPTPQEGSGVILVVDDNEALRETAAAILEDLGYQTISAQNGAEALQICRRHGASIDLVLLDTVMPVMNGFDCFYGLMENDPGARVVLSSGFTLEDDIAELKEKGLKGFIQKPYHASELGQVVYDALNA